MKHILPYALVMALLATPVHTAAQSNSRALVEATYELVDLMNVETSIRLALNAQTDVMIENSPQLLPYRDVFSEFYATVIDMASVKEKIVMLYLNTFTESEIRDLIRFYSTDTGQKLLSKESEMFQAMMDIGQEMVQSKLTVLEEMIREREFEISSEFARSIDLFEFIEGRWDFTGEGPTCSVNPFTLTVSENRSQFTSQSEKSDEDSKPSTSIYEVLDVKPEYIRSRIIGEERLTDAGEPVIWDIIPLNETSFCWRRADWVITMCTVPIQRCD